MALGTSSFQYAQSIGLVGWRGYTTAQGAANGSTIIDVAIQTHNVPISPGQILAINILEIGRAHV